MPTFHSGGLFHGSTPGRADKIKTQVPNGAHIIPADVVSGIGQGNTMAGAKALDSMFGIPFSGHGKMGGHGRGMPHIQHRATGGFTKGAVPVFVSDGEYAIHPESVKKIGGGNQDHGHEILNHFIKIMIKKITDKMKKLPGPK